MPRHDLLALLALAKLGCAEKYVLVSSSRLAKELDVSQQTAARRLKQLEDRGYAAREISPRGQSVRLTSKGVEKLRELQSELGKIFESYGQHAFVISGEVSSGMGEGRYYMELEGYKRQFKEKLGFEPYPGTLNLRLKKQEDIGARRALQNLSGIQISGFQNAGRTFGAVKCFRAAIGKTSGAVIIPARSHYGFETLEVIAPKKIRSAERLKEGSVVTVKVEV